MNDFIEWNGGDCPVSGSVVVMLRGYGDKCSGLSDDAENLRWSHNGTPSDIVYYKKDCKK